MIKKIDKLLLTGVVPPFIMTFSIALFVLMMQMLWKAIDDIMGKGASIWMILEYLFYLAIHLIPMALPLAVLMSTLMVIGNLAERYELSSMKSAGIPLVRIMRPLMVFSFSVAVFAFFCANNLTPIATLKFKSRLQDMKKQKPTLSLEEGVFNEDFNKVTIRIGKKNKDGERIEDVLIYDHDASMGKDMNRIIAEKGRMFSDEVEQLFIMQLENGTQYQSAKKAKGNDLSLPFVRTKFKEYTKVFDLGEFEIKETDENIYKNHHAMLSSRQLLNAIDSINIKTDDRLSSLNSYMEPYFYFLKNKDSSEAFVPIDSFRIIQKRNKIISAIKPKEKIAGQEENSVAIVNKKPKARKALLKQQGNQKFQSKSTSELSKSIAGGRIRNELTVSNGQKKKKPLLVDLDTSYTRIEAHIYVEEKSKAYRKAAVLARGIRNQTNLTTSSIERLNKSKIKHQNELYRKWTLAFACFMFLFIGAPMGAIIRKGGFGFPILVSTLFFVLFIILLISGDKLAQKGFLHPAIGVTLPCLVLTPVSIFLTYKALNDSKILDLDVYLAPIKKFFKRKKTIPSDATASG